MPPSRKKLRERWKQKQHKGVRRKPDSRVYLAVDNPKRGPGRHGTGFAMSRTLQSVQRVVRSNRALNMEYKEIDGHRSTKQAAPVPCFFNNKRADKRNPCIADLAGLPSERTAQGPSWSATRPPPDRYKCRYDPIHMAVRNRDKPVPHALCIIRAAELMRAPRPSIFARQRNSPHTSGGGHNGEILGGI